MTAAASVLLAAASAGTASAASRFDDGSFEYPVAPRGSFVQLSPGQTMGPWTVVSGTVDHIGAGFWQAAEGDQSVDLSGTSAGTVAQTFTTVPGTRYTVSYAVAGNPAGPPAVKTGKVLVDGQNVQDFTFDITGRTATDMGYVYRELTFRATKATTTLTFASTTAGAYGPVLDDVTVEACRPCPAC